MKIRVLVDTRVNLSANTVVEVSEQEGLRLLALGFGAKAEDKKATKKVEETVEVAVKEVKAEVPEKKTRARKKK